MRSLLRTVQHPQNQLKVRVRSSEDGVQFELDAFAHVEEEEVCSS